MFQFKCPKERILSGHWEGGVWVKYVYIFCCFFNKNINVKAILTENTLRENSFLSLESCTFSIFGVKDFYQNYWFHSPCCRILGEGFFHPWIIYLNWIHKQDSLTGQCRGHGTLVTVKTPWHFVLNFKHEFSFGTLY